MQPTTQVSQTDYNKMADWAKPSYEVQQSPNPIASSVPLQQPQGAIPSTALQPVAAIKIPQTATPDTTSAGIIGGTQPSVDMALQNFDQAKGAVGTQAEDSRSALTKMAENIFGQKADAQANQVNLENQLGLQEQQKALSSINTEIASEQIALRGEQERIRQGYGTEAQKQISNNTLNDTYGRRLADLAIRQSAANQNISAIQSNAERQTKLLTAPLDTKIQYLSTFAKDNVDYLDKKQTEKLNFIVDDLKTQKADIQALQNAKTQMITEIANNGGGTNTALIARIQNAKDMGEVTTIGASSGYIGKETRLNNALDRQYKQAQIGKIYQDMAESRATAEAKKAGLTLTPVSAARIQTEVSGISNLAQSNGIKSAVGTSIFSRQADGFLGKTFKALTLTGVGDAKRKLTGETQNFIAGVEQLRQQSTLDKLTEAKANGATFGALSDGERQTLAAAATKLGTWAVKDKNENVIGYNTSEANFKKELDTINNFKKLDYLYRGGNPLDVGVIKTPDGQYATQNSDGTYSILQ